MRKRHGHQADSYMHWERQRSQAHAGCFGYRGCIPLWRYHHDYWDVLLAERHEADSPCREGTIMLDGRTWLTMDEAAQLLGMSRGHLSKLVENDRLAYDCRYVAQPRPGVRRERLARRPAERSSTGGVTWRRH